MMTATTFVHVVWLAALLTNCVFVVVVGTTIDSSTECSNEVASCKGDSTCIVCASELSALFESTTGDSTTEYSECLVGNIDDTTSVSACEALEAIECCFSDDCFDNEAFSSVWECSVESEGCSTEDVTCEETSSAATTSTEEFSIDETSTATTTETTIDLSTECSNEVASCRGDYTCIMCASEFSAIIESITSDSTTEYSECLGGNVDQDTSVIDCDVYGAIGCCLTDDCFENEAFSSLWECGVESYGCSTEDVSCDETSTAATTETTIDSSTECSNEVASCSSDYTCIVCVSELSAIFESTTGDSTTEYSECLLGNLDNTTTVTDCDMYGAIECCLTDNCFENEAFSSFWECGVESEGCSTGHFCNETSSAAITATIGTAGLSHFVCVILLVLTLVGMGF